MYTTWPHPIITSRRAGRFAPTPTGHLHIGNAYSALLSLISARAQGLAHFVRVDDLDTARVAAHNYTNQQLEELDWLGIEFDEGLSAGGVAEPYNQAARSGHYEEALRALNRRGLLYPCYCTRREIVAAAPHAHDEGYVYPLTCRPSTPSPIDLAEVRSTPRNGRLPSIRLNTGALKNSLEWTEGSKSPQELNPRVTQYQDLVFGLQYAHLDHEIGDFVLQRSDGVYGYQLACAVDDYLQGCALVARGADLITSTHRQRLILAALGARPELTPRYAHAGLVVDAQGERLAKRNRSLSLAGLRESGVSPARLRASLSRALGGPDTDQLAEMVKTFQWSQVSREPVSWSL